MEKFNIKSTLYNSTKTTVYRAVSFTGTRVIIKKLNLSEQASIRKMSTFCEKTVETFSNAIIDAALVCMKMSRNKLKTVKI